MTAGRTPLYTLTHAQKRIWYLENLYPGTALNNLGGVIRFSGSIDMDILEESIHRLIGMHEGIRLQICLVNGEPRQYVAAPEGVRIRRIDFSELDHPHKKLREWAEAELRRPMPLYDCSLFDLALIKISLREYGYFLKVHHVIADGWSLALFSQQVAAIYRELRTGEKNGIRVANGYLSVIQKEQDYLLSARFQRDREYWISRFSSFSSRPWKARTPNSAGKRQVFQIDDGLAGRVHEWLVGHHLSANAFFVGVMLIHLYLSSGQDDITIGTPVANRSGVREKETFGMFTSTMPFRTKVNRLENISAFMKRVQQELTRCYFHQRYPYDILIQDLGLTSTGDVGLFSCSVNYYNADMVEESVDGQIRHDEYYSGGQFYPIQFVIKEWHGDLQIQCDYNFSQYSDYDVQIIGKRLQDLVERLIDGTEATVQDFVVAAKREDQLAVREINATDADFPNCSVDRLFEEQVSRTPTKIAVSEGSRSVSYRELNGMANRIARGLGHLGVRRGTLVGVFMDHSIETVAVLLGILKAGGAYVPIDPDYPPLRIQTIIDDSGLTYVFASHALDPSVSYSGMLLTVAGASFDDPSTPLKVSMPSDAAYVIYTSGTTDTPKGVVVEHHSLANYLWWAQQTYLRNDEDTMALYSSLSFDLTVTSIFTPLISGHQVIIYPNDGKTFNLHRLLRDRRTTVVKATPSHLSLLTDADLHDNNVRRWILGGERLTAAVARWLTQNSDPTVEVFNEYGPTETTVGSMVHLYDPKSDTGDVVPIGAPIANTQVYVLDSNMEPVPEGRTGQIFIAGEGLARGYLNQPELTRDRFVNNPFNLNRKMYMTGDLGVRHSDGRITYLMRSDRQLKIGGHRVELLEIERCLLRHPSVREVLVTPSRDSHEMIFLTAYFTSRLNGTPVFELRRHLNAQLPYYMVPRYLVPLDRFPVNENGKIDEHSLPDPAVMMLDQGGSMQPDRDTSSAILEAVSDVLNVEAVTLDDSFFELGGDSITAIYLVNRLRQSRVTLTVREVLANPNLRELAVLATINTQSAYPQGRVRGTLPMTPIMSWFFKQKFEDPNYWNQSVLLELDGRPGSLEVQRALKNLIEHHDALRLYWDEGAGKLRFAEQIDDGDLLTVYDISRPSADECRLELRRLATEFKLSTTLTRPPLFRGALFNAGPLGQRLLLTAHHLISDAVSWQIIMEDLASLLQGRALPLKSHSILEWAKSIASYASGLTDADMIMWKKILAVSTSAGTDYGRRVPLSEARTLVRTLTLTDTELLVGAANRAFQTNPQDLLVTALARACQALGLTNLVVDLETHGRDSALNTLDVSRTVGWFTNFYPVGLRLDSEDIEYQLRAVKKNISDARSKALDYGVLSFVADRLKVSGPRWVRFNYLGHIDGPSRNMPVHLAAEDHGPDISPTNHLTVLIDLVAAVKNRQFFLKATFVPQLGGEVEPFLDRFIDNLRGLIHFCVHRGRELSVQHYETIALDEAKFDGLFDDDI